VSVDEGGGERSHRDIVALLDGATLTPAIRERSKSVFGVLAAAEGRIHSISPEDVHFHEVGGLDAIIDVVACCAALEEFLPARIMTSPIATGAGLVQTAHGPLPLPAPAVTEILQGSGAALVERGDGELITPTGAALLLAFSDGFGPLPAMTIESSGYGAGAGDGAVPNVLRVLTGELIEESPSSGAILIETNLDDMAPELLPHVIDSLLEAGAHDAWITPILMKKGRPGFTLSALCAPITQWHMMEIMFRETTTLGMRVTPVQRTVAERHRTEVEVAGQRVRVKIGSRHGEVISTAPEYEDVLAASQATGIPLKEIYSRALHKAMEEADSEA
jgi:uncharacterized protein (TIGR00299 family) protein